MFTRNTTLGAAITVLEQEISARQSLIAAVQALLVPSSLSSRAQIPAGAARPRVAVLPRPGSLAGVAIEILEAAGRPLHGITELIPALEARGVKVYRAGLATALLRTGRVVRTARGVFAAKPADSSAS